MILILTERYDPHADVVIASLKWKGADYLRFETADFPQKIGITIEINDKVDREYLNLNGARIDLGSVHSVWNRRPRPPEISSHLSGDDQEFARRESAHVLRALWSLLRHRFWVNPYDNSHASEYKPYQLQVAQEIGFAAPRTLITNQPAEALAFFERFNGEIIYKCLTQFARTGEAGRTLVMYTNRVKKQDLSRLESVRLAPCLFQEYVNKKVELRVTVVGRKLFAAEIHSQSSERSKDDWRRYDLENTPYSPHDLPEEVAEKCFALVRRMGLVFGCIDLILTPDDRYVFLEINPNGQWYFVERLTGLPLLDNFTEMLIQGTANYADPVVQGLVPGASAQV